jgi:hypothetical protein
MSETKTVSRSSYSWQVQHRGPLHEDLTEANLQCLCSILDCELRYGAIQT